MHGYWYHAQVSSIWRDFHIQATSPASCRYLANCKPDLKVTVMSHCQAQGQGGGARCTLQLNLRLIFFLAMDESDSSAFITRRMESHWGGGGGGGG